MIFNEEKMKMRIELNYFKLKCYNGKEREDQSWKK